MHEHADREERRNHEHLHQRAGAAAVAGQRVHSFAHEPRQAWPDALVRFDAKHQPGDGEEHDDEERADRDHEDGLARSRRGDERARRSGPHRPRRSARRPSRERRARPESSGEYPVRPAARSRRSVVARPAARSAIPPRRRPRSILNGLQSVRGASASLLCGPGSGGPRTRLSERRGRRNSDIAPKGFTGGDRPAFGCYPSFRPFGWALSGRVDGLRASCRASAPIVYQKNYIVIRYVIC